MILRVIIALLFLCSFAQAGTYAPRKLVSAAAGSGTYYYSAGSDSYPNGSLGLDAANDFGASITVNATSITKIGVKVETKGTSNLKIMLMTPGGAVHECQTIANASLTNGSWNDVTLASPLTITSGQSVKVFYTVDTTSQSSFYYAAGSSGLLLRADYVYADFCTGTSAGSDQGIGPTGVRVYAQ